MGGKYMKNHKLSVVLNVTLALALTISIAFNFYQINNTNTTNNNTNETNVIVDGNSYNVTTDTITELATKNGELNNQNKQLSAENEKFKQEIDELNKEKTTLEDQLNKSEAQTETTESISESTSEKVSLNDLVLVDSKHFDIYEPFTDSYGNNYSIGYRLNASDGASATYSLKGEYKTLEFKIVAGEETGSDVEMSVNVSTDINPNMVNIPKITKLTEVQSKPFGPYDITGARTLTFTTNETGFNSYGHCYLVEAYVSK